MMSEACSSATTIQRSMSLSASVHRFPLDPMSQGRDNALVSFEQLRHPAQQGRPLGYARRRQSLVDTFIR